MTHLMEYKGYYGKVDFSPEDQVLFGKVAFIPSLISYEADNVKDLIQAFHDAVDDYLDLCESQGKTPDSPFKGSFNVRVGSDLHRKAMLYSIEQDLTLNSLVNQALEAYLNGSNVKADYILTESPKSKRKNLRSS